MNNKGLASNTVIIIGVLALITVVSLSSLMITQFYSTPGLTPIPTNDTYSPLYTAAYANISAQQGVIEDIGQPNVPNLFSAAYLAVSTLFTTTVLGISTIATIALQLPIALQTILVAMQAGPGFISTLVFGFLGAATIIYIVMRALQAARGTTEEV